MRHNAVKNPPEYGWQYTGQSRPEFAAAPQKGQESVWDYPRPPRLVEDTRQVIVEIDQYLLADSRRCIRLLETASPPTFYIPIQDIDTELLQKSASSSYCEWKGVASYFDFQHQSRHINNIGWHYPAAQPPYSELQDYISFYPSRTDCYVDGEKVIAQLGHFYGGWITHEIVGPFKGDDFSKGW